MNTIQLGATLPSATPRRIGLALSGLAILVLLADAVAQLLAIPPVLNAAASIGWPSTPALWQCVGAVLAAATLLYAIPRTAFLGGLLITGYLGGAVASHVRVGEDIVGPTIAAVAICAIVWGALWLRDERFRALTRAR
ncbi:DoxX family protein [Scleromatobacter humisilvae]|uniref:DoxX family protein n=1 Tax=Scleromatobacter humisilvae TaxID=2897159 RepID=A0A9X2BX96_9BURK|nr:DoxX family protein [Scleromatobacter humisilvae]MCK9684348.1 DoxX family protein [Scleromatobacter humisilvae]